MRKFMATVIRKTFLQVETTHIEGGKEAATSLKLVAALAMVKNPGPVAVSFRI